MVDGQHRSFLMLVGAGGNPYRPLLRMRAESLHERAQFRGHGDVELEVAGVQNALRSGAQGDEAARISRRLRADALDRAHHPRDQRGQDPVTAQ